MKKNIELQIENEKTHLISRDRQKTRGVLEDEPSKKSVKPAYNNQKHLFITNNL